MNVPNPQSNIPPSLALSGGFRPGIITGKADTNDSIATAVNPGGVPIFLEEHSSRWSRSLNFRKQLNGGAAGFEAPNTIRADQVLDEGMRLPYFKFPRNPNN